MAKGFKITHKEFKTRAGYLLLGIFSANLASAGRDVFAGMLGSQNAFLIGNIVGILVVLYFFDF